jgi:formylglycine-generating enzyme required for sulfatase activity
MTGNIEANRDIYANILNTGQIQDHRTLNLIIADLRQVSELLELPPGLEGLTLPPGWPEALQLLSRDKRVDSLDRHRAYALWLVARPVQKPAQRQAAQDERYVPLKATLESAGLVQRFTGWVLQPDGPPQARKLADVTQAVKEHSAFVLLGAPGSGKTTVLFRLQHEAARAFLAGQSQQLPLLVSLAGYRWEQQEPLGFLREQWQTHLLDDFMERVRAGNILLLLDGLNEMRHLASYREHQQRVNSWERLLQDYFVEAGESRAVVASRTADYEQTLDLPRVEIDPLDEEQIRRFLEAYLGDEAEKALAAINRLELWELARVPYSLAVLTDLYDPKQGDLPPNQGRLFAVYADQLLLAEKKQTDLPLEAARLALNSLGYRMQQAGESTTLAAEQLEALLPAAVQTPGQRRPVETPPPAVFDLACRANLISQDPGAGPVPLYKFSHHLLQEQFAAAELLRRWQMGEELTSLWRIPRTPAEMPLARVGDWDPLPPPPPTGWEQTTLMAAGLLDWADTFVRAVLAANPSLAGRCLSEGAANVNAETRQQVSTTLLADLGDPVLHRRLRLQTGRVLGAVGDPRFTPITINGVNLILPDLVEIPGGLATLGSEAEGAFDNERPLHQVELAPFYLARCPLTNAEYRCFIEAGGYNQERYWTPTGWQWRQGLLVESGPVQEWLDIRQTLLKDPQSPARWFAEGRITPSQRDAWKAVIKMTEDELRQELARFYTPQAHEQAYYWQDPAYNAPNQPVVGVTWYEAMAYCAWLNEQLAVSGQPLGVSGLSEVQQAIWAGIKSKIQNPKSKMGVRLPTEAEWEWAAGGPEHTPYPWGHQFDEDKANTLEGRVLGTSSAGAYPAGTVVCGALDLAGNVWEWTHSRYKAYPYGGDDGREDPLAEGRRALRGGSWTSDQMLARVSYRYHLHPDDFDTNYGFRLVVAPVF